MYVYYVFILTRPTIGSYKQVWKVTFGWHSGNNVSRIASRATTRIPRGVRGPQSVPGTFDVNLSQLSSTERRLQSPWAERVARSSSSAWPVMAHSTILRGAFIIFHHSAWLHQVKKQTWLRSSLYISVNKWTFVILQNWKMKPSQILIFFFGFENQLGLYQNEKWESNFY